MKKILLLAIVMAAQAMILLCYNAYAGKSDKEAERIQQAQAVFQEVVDLWYEQKFDELYTRFAYKQSGKISKEKFINRMMTEKKRLACCWQKIQDVKVKLSSSSQATVYAKFGFENQSNDVVYVAAEVPLYLKDDNWKIKAQDILSAAPDLAKHKLKKKK